MQTIKVGPKFFRKERDSLYSDWPTGFWREMFQNSIDAQSSRIDIDIKDSFGGSLVIFRDNGTGMSRQVLEDVFFALGETSKNDQTTVGGFGRARVLTCFAMESYSIHTHDLLVKGAGAQYDIEETSDWHDGCEFQIIVPDKSSASMRDALVRVLSKSQMNCDVNVNGSRWTNWMYRRKETRVLDSGTVHVNKSHVSGGVIVVRVNGLWTFDAWTSCPHQVIVEIDPANSRKILTASRDGMHSFYQRNLEQWLQQLAVDKRSALREVRRKTELVRGKGMMELSIERPSDVVPANTVVVQSRAASEKPSPDVVRVLEAIIRVGEQKADRLTGGSTTAATESAGLPDYYSVYIEDDTENSKIRRVIDNYNPKNWVESVKKVRGEEQKYRKGANYRKLLVAWQVACEFALRALMKYNGEVNLSWLVGWTFNDEQEASHVKVEGGHALCLNPVGEDGKMRYGVTCRSDLLSIMALAKHEAAHVSVAVHNEDFSTVHTAIDKRFDTVQVLRAIRDAVGCV